ncbi:MAG TPA: zf-HC2 domain-containing protein [Gemmataceae bacterium]|nr:zf-HC2 domain-containing protein [Gemmataceae bacterium]
MMTCREFAEILIDFVSGDIAQDQRSLVEEHLGGCRHCVAYAETYQLTIVVVRNLPKDALPAHCEQRLRARIEKELGRALDPPDA